MPLIHTITKASDAGYGVNLWSIAPPASTLGAQSRTIGIVGDFPWGPVNTPTVCYSFQDVINTFCPDPLGYLATSDAMKAFIGKSFPGPLTLVRIDATSAAAQAYSYTVSGGTVVATATYKGAAGAAISITWAAATDADSAHRNVTVTVGTGYSATYENVTLTSITAVSDPYVVFTKGSTPSALPAAGASANTTTAGSNGSAVSGDYVGSSSSNVGIRQFYGASATVDVDVLFVAECPSSLADAVNTGLKAWATSSGKNGIAVLCSVASQTASTAASYASSYASDQVAGCWPRVKIADERLATSPTITVDGNAFLAVAIAGSDAWESPEGANNSAFSKIVGVADDTATDTALDAIKTGGLCAFYMDPILGCIIRGAVTTSTTSGQTDIVRSTYRLYFWRNFAPVALHYVGKATQVDLQGNRLGSSIRPLYDWLVGFLQDEKTKEHINAYSVDPFGSNVQADIDAGTWTIAVAIDTFAPLRKLILRAQIGSTVTVA